MQQKVGSCGCPTWGTRGWVAATSCGDGGPTTPALLLKPGQSLQLWRTEAALVGLEIPKAPQCRWEPREAPKTPRSGVV